MFVNAIDGGTWMKSNVGPENAPYPHRIAALYCFLTGRQMCESARTITLIKQLAD